MSDYIVYMIPKDAYLCIDAEEITKIIFWLKQTFVSDYITYQTSEFPQFVDCGSNLETLICPICDQTISFDWWNNMMNACYDGDQFTTLLVETPCCQKIISLNDIQYHEPCGFSCIVFRIYNPIIEIDKTFIKQFETQVGFKIKCIQCHL